MTQAQKQGGRTKAAGSTDIHQCPHTPHSYAHTIRPHSIRFAHVPPKFGQMPLSLPPRAPTQARCRTRTHTGCVPALRDRTSAALAATRTWRHARESDEITGELILNRGAHPQEGTHRMQARATTTQSQDSTGNSSPPPQKTYPVSLSSHSVGSHPGGHAHGLHAAAAAAVAAHVGIHPRAHAGGGSLSL
jgi:hypothetical protein